MPKTEIEECTVGIGGVYVWMGVGAEALLFVFVRIFGNYEVGCYYKVS